MQIAVFGGTGRLGQQVIAQALDQDHHVVALARSPASLDPLRHPNLSIVEGDVLDPLRVGETVAGTAAVICMLGKTGNNPDNAVSKGTSIIIQQMGQHGIDRLIAVTSLGLGESKDQVPLAFKVMMKTVLRTIMADRELQEDIVRLSGLKWTIVRPGGLGDGPKSNSYTVGTGRDIKAGRVNRSDVADFILQELQEGEYVQQAVAIT